MSNWTKQVVASAVVLSGVVGTEPGGAQPKRPSGDFGTIFVKLDGIPGESADAKHKGEVDVLAWSWGIAQMGTGSTAGKTITITKQVDKSSPSLAQFAANGNHIKDATLAVRRPTDSSDYIKIKLTDVVVSSVKIGGNSREGTVEEVTLTQKNVEFAYTPSGGSTVKATLKM